MRKLITLVLILVLVGMVGAVPATGQTDLITRGEAEAILHNTGLVPRFTNQCMSRGELPFECGPWQHGWTADYFDARIAWWLTGDLVYCAADWHVFNAGWTGAGATIEEAVTDAHRAEFYLYLDDEPFATEMFPIRPVGEFFWSPGVVGAVKMVGGLLPPETSVGEHSARVVVFYNGELYIDWTVTFSLVEDC